MVKIFGIYFGKERQEHSLATDLYGHAVAAARNPILYGTKGAPDTANGRFELIILHIFLLFRRLQDQDKRIQSIKQKTFDCFLRDMDVSLCEIGVGPDGVPKRIQKMLENFYGRAAAYQTALENQDIEILTQTISRNFYSDDKQNSTGAKMLANYVLNSAQNLENASTEDLINSKFSFAA
ncbi:MAG: ubiquinol-cytochrome C chaperone [Rhizobiales bacterium]|nr:ubiquinol-cytochrome C chaperone [Hyphomicrobiales bacterium]